MTRIWFLNDLATIHLSGDQANGRFSLVEMSCPPGDQPPLHIHRDDDEGFYVLEGTVTLWYGNECLELGPGEFALAPHGVPHTYKVGEDGARMLVTSSTADFDRFVAELGRPAEEDRLPDPSVPDLDRLMAVAAEHHIEILGPPGALPSAVAA
jgi:quercetin dioxygenase-like cupin family protein